MTLRILPVTLLLSACGGVEEEPMLVPMPAQIHSHEVLTGLGFAIDPEGMTIGTGVVPLRSGSEILILNGDTDDHQITSDDHLGKDSPCAELNLRPLLPYERITFKVTGESRMCSFHDHLHHDALWFRASIQVFAGHEE